jgi:hypothetical protein
MSQKVGSFTTDTVTKAGCFPKPMIPRSPDFHRPSKKPVMESARLDSIPSQSENLFFLP